MMLIKAQESSPKAFKIGITPELRGGGALPLDPTRGPKAGPGPHL